MATWPTWMPQNPFDGFSITDESNRVTSAGDVGEPIERARSTATGATYQWRVEVTTAKMLRFRDWFLSETSSGIKPFDWTDPFSGNVYPVKIMSEPQYRLARGGWLIDLELYLFPGYIPPVIVDVSGSLAGTLPMLTASGTGDLTNHAYGAFAGSIPMLTASGSGQAIIDVVGSGDAVLPMLTAYGSNIDFMAGPGAAVLPALTGAGTGSLQLYATADAELPALTAAGAGTVAVAATSVYLQGVISSLGLTSNQVFCLDAGDGDSYAGSGQTWEDRSSAGNDFYRGSGSGSDAADPTFSGTAGGGTAAEYFVFDGGDYFTAAGSPTFDDAWGADNSTFTILGMIYLPSAGGATKAYPLFSNLATLVFNFGITLRIQQLISTTIETRLDFTATSGFTAPVVGAVSTGLIENDWVFFAMSFNEGGGATASVARLQNVTQTFDGSLTPPLSAVTLSNPKIGALGTGSSPVQSGTRLGCIAAWSAPLTASNISNIYTALKARYSSLP